MEKQGVVSSQVPPYLKNTAWAFAGLFMDLIFLFLVHF